MATIEALVAPYIKMSTKDQYSFIMEIRKRRRTKPDNPRKFKRNAKGKSSAKAKIKASGKTLTPETLLHALSPEDKAKLLKELGVI